MPRPDDDAAPADAAAHADGAADDGGPSAALLRQHATRHTAPAALATRIQAQLRAASGAPRSPRAAGLAGPAGLPGVAAALLRAWRPAALFAAGAASAWALAWALLADAPQDRLADAVVASHVRSLMASHLADVVSTDRHTVRPWFSGKLDFAPPVADLAAQRLPLVGGRLDYLDGQPVAALVYRAGPHVVNLFVWPAPSARPGAGAAAPQVASRRGYNLVHWADGGMQAWLVSDLSGTELQAAAAQLRQAMAEAGR